MNFSGPLTRGCHLDIHPFPHDIQFTLITCWASSRVKQLSAIVSPILVACFLSSCATNPAQWPSSGVYRGTAPFGFEHSDFTPDDSREKWWLSGTAVNEITDRMGGTGPTLHNPVHVVLEGVLSERGHHGHLGQYRRELRVVRVLEAKQPEKP